MVSGNNANNRDIVPPLALKDVRKELIELYDQGPDIEELNEIQQTQIEKRIDRNGFIKNEPIMPLTQASVEEIRSKEKHWLKILKRWEKFYPSKPLRKLVYNGIPESVRGEVWKRILEVPHNLSSNPGLYEHLKMIAKETSTDLRQIDLDINRTYRYHVIYRPRYSIKQKALFYVLGAYAEYNKLVGYCQGMANVGALLLMYMDESDAFWALSTLLTGKKYSMHGFFVPGFPKLLRFQIHHEKILKKFLPKLFAHFESQGIGSSLYTLKWYMQCFLDRLPFDLTLRLWDIFVLEGDKVLHPIGYTLLKYHKKELMKLDMEKIAEFLSTTMLTKTYNPDVFMKLLRENISDLKKVGLYPTPSVVEGELPIGSNLVFSTINERNQSQNRLALQLLELEESTSELVLNNDVCSNPELKSNLSETSKNIIIQDNMPISTAYNNYIKMLPKIIPPPPMYSAPVPTSIPSRTLGVLAKKRKTFKKKEQRDKTKTLPRQENMSSIPSTPIKTLYSTTLNYYTDGGIIKENYKLSDHLSANNSVFEDFDATLRLSVNEISTSAKEKSHHMTLQTTNENNSSSSKRGLLKAASMRVKSAFKPKYVTSAEYHIAKTTQVEIMLDDITKIRQRSANNEDSSKPSTNKIETSTDNFTSTKSNEGSRDDGNNTVGETSSTFEKSDSLSFSTPSCKKT